MVLVPKQSYMTGLILAGYALHAAAADAIADVRYFGNTLSGQVTGHGCRGREEVINLKLEYFRPCYENSLPTYRYLDYFSVDLENSCVRFGFHCIIPGSEGKGTEFMHFDEVSNFIVLHSHCSSNFLFRMAKSATFSTYGTPSLSRPGLPTSLIISLQTVSPAFTMSSWLDPSSLVWSKLTRLIDY